MTTAYFSGAKRFELTPLSLTLSGDLITDAVREAGDEGDGLTPPAGVGIWPAGATKNTQGTPGATATTGIAVIGAGGTLSKVVDATAPFVNGDGEVWEFVMVGGATGGARFSGTTGNTNAHSSSVWAMLTAGAGPAYLQLRNGGGTTAGWAAITAGVWTRILLPNITPGDTTAQMEVGFAGANTGTVRFTGAQLEESTIVTPFMGPDGSTASRTAGRVQQPVSGLFTATQGWVAARLAPGWASTASGNGTNQSFVWSWLDDVSNRIGIAWNGDSNQTWTMIRLASGSGGASQDADSFFANDGVTVVGYWTASELGISEGGGAFTTASDANVPTLAATSADIGNFAGAGSATIDSRVLWYATGSGTLTDADAAVLVGDDIESRLNDLSDGANPTSIWRGDTGTAWKVEQVVSSGSGYFG